MKYQEATTLLVHADGTTEWVTKLTEQRLGERWLVRHYTDVVKAFEIEGHAVARCGDHDGPHVLVYVERPAELLVEEILRAERSAAGLPSREEWMRAVEERMKRDRQ